MSGENDVILELRRLTERIIALETIVRERMRTDTQTLKDHERRIRSLEDSQRRVGRFSWSDLWRAVAALGSGAALVELFHRGGGASG